MDSYLNNIKKLLKYRKYELHQPTTSPNIGIFNLIATGIDSCSKKLCVYWALRDDKIGVKEVRVLIDSIIKEEDVKTILIVTPEPITSFAQRECLSRSKSNFKVELWNLHEFSFCVMEHIFQPKMSIISNKERKRLFGDNTAHLPKILITDPVIKFLGGKKNQVVQVSRPFPDGNFVVIHRVII